jgi:type I restriction enzyme R subunit
LADKLQGAHRAVLALVDAVPHTDDVKEDVKAVIAHLGTEDQWFVFRARADAFIKAYTALSPDPRVLPYQADLKFVGAVMPYGRLYFENVEETDWKKYSEKIRAMLDEHLEVTGLKTMCKVRSISDPAFVDDFGAPVDIKTAAVRKLAELKKETAERAATNPARYEKFSDRIKELIKQFSAGLMDAKEILDATEALAKEVLAEGEAHKGTGLNERAYGVNAILEKFKAHPTAVAEPDPPPYGSDEEAGRSSLTAIQRAALAIDGLYASDETAPMHWQEKAQMKKDLRGQVRRLVKGLGLDDWKIQVPSAIEHYAVIHYSKP